MVADRLSSQRLGPFSRRDAANYLVFAGLTAINAQGQLVPELLANLPTPQNHEVLHGGTTLLLKLRRYQYWSSGVEITSQDIVFGWEVECRPTGYQGQCGDILSVTSAGRYEAVLRLKQPDASILAYGLLVLLPHSWSALGGTPQAAVARLQENSFDYFNSSYWTDGPYQVTRVFGNPRQIVLRPMRYYRLHSRPHITRLVFKVYSALDALEAAAAQQQADVTDGDSLTSLRAHPGPYTILLVPTFDTTSLLFNVRDATYNGQPNPAHDTRVRQALALAVNRVAVTRAMLGIGPRAARKLITTSLFFTSGHPEQATVPGPPTGTWDPLAHRYVRFGTTAVRDARALLRRAGYSHGLHIELTIDAEPQDPLPEFGVLRSNWAAIGVSTTLFRDGGGECFGRLRAMQGAFEVYLARVSGDVDPDALRPYLDSRYVFRNPRNLRHPGSGVLMCDFHNDAGIEDPIIDQGLRQGAATFDSAQRRHWYSQVQERVDRQAYWVSLLHWPDVMTYNRHVTGMTGNPEDYFEYAWNARQWEYRP